MKLLNFKTIAGEEIVVNPDYVVAAYKSPDYPSSDHCVLVFGIAGAEGNSTIVLSETFGDVVQSLSDA